MQPVSDEPVGNSVSASLRPRRRLRQLRDDKSITQTRVDAAGTNLGQATDPKPEVQFRSASVFHQLSPEQLAHQWEDTRGGWCSQKRCHLGLTHAELTIQEKT